MPSTMNPSSVTVRSEGSVKTETAVVRKIAALPQGPRAQVPLSVFSAPVSTNKTPTWNDTSRQESSSGNAKKQKTGAGQGPMGRSSEAGPSSFKSSGKVSERLDRADISSNL